MAPEKKEKGFFKRTAVRDLCLILAFLVLALAVFLASHLGARAGSWAVVSVDGVETARYSLSVDGTYVLNGGTNTLEILDGRVRMTGADCPNHLCVKQGWVRYSGQSIVCLPNKVTVTVYGADGTYDAVI